MVCRTMQLRFFKLGTVLTYAFKMTLKFQSKFNISTHLGLAMSIFRLRFKWEICVIAKSNHHQGVKKRCHSLLLEEMMMYSEYLRKLC